jgi:excisionase family DNA binding protein
MTDTTEPTPDLLYGVPRIAEYLGLSPAAVYHLAAQNRIPTFKMGRTVCARRSTLAAKIAELEADSRTA